MKLRTWFPWRHERWKGEVDSDCRAKVLEVTYSLGIYTVKPAVDVGRGDQ